MHNPMLCWGGGGVGHVGKSAATSCTSRGRKLLASDIGNEGCGGVDA